jgi:RNase adaptor protein for sRNA GlmZ degradation
MFIKYVKLIHDKFENDFGFIEGTHVDNMNIVIDELKQISYQHCPITIYSWGLKKDIIADDCELIFDVSLFFTKIEDRSNLSNMTGKDIEIQESILCHPRFLDLIKLVISTIDDERPKCIAFVCNHGKHRSVGWAEIMKIYLYNKSCIKHLNLI